jgi:hypothetical protein
MDYESTALTVKLIAQAFLIDLTHTPINKFSNHQSGKEWDGNYTHFKGLCPLLYY